eukprot:c2166_g1_i1.p1 GENE.c2166_g1_i1~~c2166_g1_i1.p1  ORF type:complete len:434 (-),score=79.41 c2166_g1_i1:70-1326(-)
MGVYTVRKAVFNLCNAAIGAGILAIPLAFRDAGLVGGFICAIALVILVFRTSMIISRKGDEMYEADPSLSQISYQSVIAHFLGYRVSQLVSVTLLLYLYGVSVGLFIIVGHQLHPVLKFAFGTGVWDDRRLTTVVFCSVFIFPWTLLRNLDRLQPTGILCVASCAYVLVIGVIKSVIHAADDGFASTEYIDPKGVFKALPVFCFAYQLHLQVPLVVSSFRGVNLPPPKSTYTSLKEPFVPQSVFPKMYKSLMWTFIVCFVLYSVFGCFGYLRFGKHVQSDILKNFPDDDIAIVIARVAIAFTAGVSYPINHLPARVAILEFLPSIPSLFYVETVIWYILAMALAMVVDDLGVVFRIIGSTVGVMVIFILPGWLLYGADHSDGLELLPSRNKYEKIEAIAMIVVGTVIGVLGVLFVFYD